MVLVGALVLGVLLGTLQSTAKSKGKVDVVSSAVRSVVLLPAGSLRSGSDAWQDFVRGVLGGRRRRRGEMATEESPSPTS